MMDISNTFVISPKQSKIFYAIRWTVFFPFFCWSGPVKAHFLVRNALDRWHVMIKMFWALLNWNYFYFENCNRFTFFFFVILHSHIIYVFCCLSFFSIVLHFVFMFSLVCQSYIWEITQPFYTIWYHSIIFILLT